MKLLLDFLPIILFFATFKYAEANAPWAQAFATEHLGTLVASGQVGAQIAPVLLATVVVVFATLGQVAWLAARKQRIDAMLWVSLALVVVLGGATVWLQSETFIKWKPTGLYWVMGLSLGLSQWLFGKNLLRALMGSQMVLPEIIWGRLNLAWVSFFGLMGALNLWVAYGFSTATWVNFKLFGGIGLMLLFVLAQGLVLSRYLPDEAAEPETH